MRLPLLVALFGQTSSALTPLGNVQNSLLNPGAAASTWSQRQRELGQQLERDERQQAVLQQQMIALQADIEQVRRDYSLASATASDSAFTSGDMRPGALEPVAAGFPQRGASYAAAIPAQPAQFAQQLASPAYADADVANAALPASRASSGLLEQAVQPMMMPAMPSVAAATASAAAPLPAASASSRSISALLQSQSQSAVAEPSRPVQDVEPPPRIPMRSAEAAPVEAASAAAMPAREMQVTLPADAVAGSVYSFFAPDRQRHAFQVPEGVSPGSTVSVAW